VIFFLVATMKSMRDSQISHPFVSSILSWIGTDGQCLAALHTHISALEPDQLTQPRICECYIHILGGYARKSPTLPKLWCDWWSYRSHIKGDWSILVSAQWRCRAYVSQAMIRKRVSWWDTQMWKAKVLTYIRCTCLLILLSNFDHRLTFVRK